MGNFFGRTGRTAAKRCWAAWGMAAAVMALGTASWGQTTAESQPTTLPAAPTINVEVTEWAVFVTDEAEGLLNRREAFNDSLPSFVNNLRKPPAVEEAKQIRETPAPVGVLRLMKTGPVATDATIDVQLTYRNGRALGEWPRAKGRNKGVLWQDIQLSDEKTGVRTLEEGHWMERLRQEGPWLKYQNVSEPFLLYDMELAYPVKLEARADAAAGPGNYRVWHRMDAPMRDLTLYQPQGEGKWRTATIQELAGDKETDAKAASTQAASQPTSQPTSRPTTQEGAPPTARAVAFQSPPTGAAEALAPWRARLSAAGVRPGDQEVILQILTQQALDKKRLTAIYRMDPAEFDKTLALEVVPQPRKISRMALVIVKGFDPAIHEELEALISQLGDPSWEKREAATQEIKQLGSMAKPKLEQAVKQQKDLEIVFRVEQLLQLLNKPQTEGQANP